MRHLLLEEKAKTGLHFINNISAVQKLYVKASP